VTQEVCGSHGLPSYEISNHARPGAECKHNLVYWRGDEYAGVGPGAHGRLDIDGVRHAVATVRPVTPVIPPGPPALLQKARAPAPHRETCCPPVA